MLRNAVFLICCLIACRAEAQKIAYQIPPSITSGQEFQVSFKIPIQGIKGMARLQQDFPKGFEVKETEGKNVIFSFSNSGLQVLWLQLPESDSLPVTYTVRCIQGFGGKAEIPSTFQYLENDQRRELKLNPMSFTVGGDATKRFVPIKKEAEASAPSPSPAKPALSTATVTKPQTAPKPAENTAASKAKSEAPKTAAPAPAKTTENASGATESATPSPQKSPEVKVVEKNFPESKGISFRIQIAALPDKTDKAILAKNYSVALDAIREEQHNGMYKYTVGDYSTLADARKVMNGNPSMKSSCFVAGYENGQRIDLEEAIRKTKK